MSKFFVVGKNINYSFSRIIHEEYLKERYEIKSVDTVDNFLAFLKEDFSYINVTIPYKYVGYQNVDCLDNVAKETKATNLIIKKDKKLFGYNTDVFGFKKLVEHYHINLANSRILILGTGATSNSVTYALKELRVKSICYLSSSKKDKNIFSYNELDKVNDVDYIINTTPVTGININELLINSVDQFNNLKAYIDVNYNPFINKQMKLFIDNNIRAYSGLYMLVAQAIKSVSIYKNIDIEDKEIERCFIKLFTKENNIVLIGHPGSGKTTLGNSLATSLNMKFVDTDSLIEQKENMRIATIFDEKGEKYFRKLESEVIKEISSNKGQVISSGGGAILDEQNITALRNNSLIINLKRNTTEPLLNRPLIKNDNDFKKLLEERKHLYKKYQDYELINKDINKSIKEVINLL